MESTNTKIKKLEGLIGTNDISLWEHDFLQSIVRTSDHGKKPSALSERQVEVVERIYAKHFAGG